jgi:tagatose 6-phosphate kinase
MILAIHLNPAIDRVYAVEKINIGSVARPLEMTANAGGKASNVSRVVRLMDEDVIACGFIGGYSGDFIENDLNKLGIQTAFTRINGESRSCINIFDQSTGLSTEVLEQGPEISSNEQDAFIEQYDFLLDRSDLVSASGSLASGLNSDFYNMLIQKAKNKNKPFLLDTSGHTLKQAIGAAPYLIKPNGDEISDYVGSAKINQDSIQHCLVQFKKKGIQLPVVSLGENGCLALIQGDTFHFKHPALKVKNAVGSGDAFIAGCAVGLVRKKSQIDVIKLGIACGMANTQYFKTGVVSKALVEKYLSLIEVNKV